MSTRPAQVFGLTGGTLAVGAPADVVVFDPEARWKVDASQFLSKGRNSPYDGMSLVGRAACTIVAGSGVYRSGVPARAGSRRTEQRG